MENNEIFKEFEAQKAIHPNLFCHIGWLGKNHVSFEIFAESYYECANTLYKNILANPEKNNIVDGHGMVMCFLYRHFVELFIKALYIKFVPHTEDELKNFLNSNHSLNDLWNQISPTLEDKKRHIGSKVDLEEAKKYIKAIAEFDPKSMTMRYPIDKRLKKIHDEIRIDIVVVHEKMEILYGILTQITSELDNTIDRLAKDEDINAFESKYKSLKSKVEKVLEDLKNFIKDDEEDDIDVIYLFNENYLDKIFHESPEDRYWKDLDIEVLAMCEILYYVGRDIYLKEIKLAIEQEQKRKEIISYCLWQQKILGVDFSNIERNEMGVTNKGVRYVIDYINTAIQNIG